MLSDCQDLWNAVHSLVPNLKEKRLRDHVSAIQEAIREDDVADFNWVSKDVQCADALTKHSAQAGPASRSLLRQALEGKVLVGLKRYPVI